MNIIPVEIKYHILSFLEWKHLFQYQSVCQEWLQIINSLMISPKISEMKLNVLIHIFERKDFLTRVFPKLSPKMKNYVCAFCAHQSQNEEMKYCLEHGAIWNDLCRSYQECFYLKITKPSVYDMVMSGTYDPKIVRFVQKYSSESKHESNLVNMIIKYDRIDLIGIMNKNDISIGNVIATIKYKPYQILKWWFTETGRILDTFTNYDFQELIYVTVQQNDYHLLQTICNYLCYHGYFFRENPLKEAARANQLHFVKWVIARFYQFNEDSVRQFQCEGYFFLSKWINHRQFSLDDYLLEVMLIALSEGNMEIVEWLYHTYQSELDCTKKYSPIEIFRRLVRKDNLVAIQWLLEWESSYSEIVSLHAAKNRELEVIQWLVENEYNINITKCLAESIQNNHLEMLIYLSKKYEKMTIEIWDQLIRSAILKDRLKMVKFLMQFSDETMRKKYYPTIWSIGKEKKCLFDGCCLFVSTTNQRCVDYYLHYHN